jgi:hypothetical protein
MSAFLRMYCNRLKERIGLPPEFKMEVDESTDNILVSNGVLGFVITKHACIDFPISRIVREAKESIELIQEAKPGELPQRVLRDDQLRHKSGDTVTVFDRG